VKHSLEKNFLSKATKKNVYYYAVLLCIKNFSCKNVAIFKKIIQADVPQQLRAIYVIFLAIKICFKIN